MWLQAWARLVRERVHERALPVLPPTPAQKQLHDSAAGLSPATVAPRRRSESATTTTTTTSGILPPSLAGMVPKSTRPVSPEQVMTAHSARSAVAVPEGRRAVASRGRTTGRPDRESEGRTSRKPQRSAGGRAELASPPSINPTGRNRVQKSNLASIAQLRPGPDTGTSRADAARTSGTSGRNAVTRVGSEPVVPNIESTARRATVPCGHHALLQAGQHPVHRSGALRGMARERCAQDRQLPAPETVRPGSP